MLESMRRARRSDLLLAALAVVAGANGVLLGLSLYGLLTAVLKLLDAQRPSLAYAWLAGGLAGLSLIALSLQRERLLREPALSPSGPAPEDEPEDPLGARLDRLVEASGLSYSPSLWWVECVEPNAFAVGQNRDQASVVVTTGLLESLEPAEIDAVLAHEIAHVESEDLKIAGRADAVADSIDDLARAKGRFFWGPKVIVADMQPFIVTSLAGFVLVAALLIPGKTEAWVCCWPSLHSRGSSPFGEP